MAESFDSEFSAAGGYDPLRTITEGIMPTAAKITTPALIHVSPLTARDPSTRRGVHLMFSGGPASLCNRWKAQNVVEGASPPATVQGVFPVEGPVTCYQCTKGLEMIVRDNVAHLSVADLEEVAALAFRLRPYTNGKTGGHHG